MPSETDLDFQASRPGLVIREVLGCPQLHPFQGSRDCQGCLHDMKASNPDSIYLSKAKHAAPQLKEQIGHLLFCWPQPAGMNGIHVRLSSDSGLVHAAEQRTYISFGVYLKGIKTLTQRVNFSLVRRQ